MDLQDVICAVEKNEALPCALERVDADSVAAAAEATIALYRQVKAGEVRNDETGYKHFKAVMFETARGAMRQIDESGVTSALKASYPALEGFSLSKNNGLLLLDEWVLRYQFGMPRQNISKWWAHIDAHKSEILAQLCASDATMTSMLAYAERTFDLEDGPEWHYNSKSKVVKVAGAVLAAVNVAGALGAITGIGAAVAVASAAVGSAGMLL